MLRFFRKLLFRVKSAEILIQKRIEENLVTKNNFRKMMKKKKAQEDLQEKEKKIKNKKETRRVSRVVKKIKGAKLRDSVIQSRTLAENVETFLMMTPKL